MSLIIDTSIESLQFKSLKFPCRIGKKGALDWKKGREGDQKTPIGDYHLRFGLYRNDRLAHPNSRLYFRAMRQNDGWCDAPADPAYNRFIRLPYPASHEKLWRDDGAYDIILVISHNDSPPKSGLGSAVFIHVSQPDDRKTMGCVALEPEVIINLLPSLYSGMHVKII